MQCTVMPCKSLALDNHVRANFFVPCSAAADLIFKRFPEASDRDMGSSSKARRFSAADFKESKRKTWKGHQNKKEKKGKGQGKKTSPSIIPKHAYFAKSKLAPYVNEDGIPFYTGKSQDEKSALKYQNMRKALNASNEELCRSLGMGLALDAATLDHGVKAIIKHCGGDWPQEMKEALAKTGIPFIKDALATEEGRAFAEAAQLLNVGRTKKPDGKKVRKAVEKFMKHCVGQGSEWQSTLQGWQRLWARAT